MINNTNSSTNGDSSSHVIGEELVLRAKSLAKTSVYETEEEACEGAEQKVDNRIHYNVIWGMYENEDGVEYTSFGIQAENRQGVVFRIPDISTDQFLIGRLADILNKYRVSRYHVRDIIEDYILCA